MRHHSDFAPVHVYRAAARVLFPALNTTKIEMKEIHLKVLDLTTMVTTWVSILRTTVHTLRYTSLG